MTLTGILLDEPLNPGSDEWWQTYSASQVAAIVGLSKWDTPRSIYDAKKGITPREPQTDAQGRGHQFEPLIRGWVAGQNPEWTVSETGCWRHHERTNHTATPDGIVVTAAGERELLEIKTAEDIYTWGDTLLITYMVQVAWQMYVTGAQRCHVAVCGPFELFNRRPKMFVIERNDADIAALVRRVDKFDAALSAGIQPAADHSRLPDQVAVRYGNTEIVDNPGLEIPDSLAVPYLDAFMREAEVKAAKASTASQLLEYLGSQKKATYRGHTIATRVNGRGDNPPTLRGVTGLADLATELLTNEKAAA
ncbi:YqaJ viral recombinase family protein [Rhodococcoides fascians]|uniref:YqaJ viral recombinase family protein n=1 Tax=Rhodococcoides fascians TaxID=1828 RepID=UPI00055A6410|nr:YqaJ viral recombinase family protein [Rhodococcus fascians]